MYDTVLPSLRLLARVGSCGAALFAAARLAARAALAASFSSRITATESTIPTDAMYALLRACASGGAQSDRTQR